MTALRFDAMPSTTDTQFKTLVQVGIVTLDGNDYVAVRRLMPDGVMTEHRMHPTDAAELAARLLGAARELQHR